MPLSILGSYFKIPRHDTQCRWRANRRIIHDMHRTYGLILPLARLWNFMRQVPGCALVVLEPPRLLECHFSIPGITLVQTDRLHSSAALILAKECLSTTRRHWGQVFPVGVLKALINLMWRARFCSILQHVLIRYSLVDRFTELSISLLHYDWTDLLLNATNFFSLGFKVLVERQCVFEVAGVLAVDYLRDLMALDVQSA